MEIWGAGLGLRREMLNELVDIPAEMVRFFEIAPENWMNAGGIYANQLRSFSERFPFVCHGLSLSIGSADEIDVPFVQSIKRFMQDHDIKLYTEHLSWCSYKGHLYDLLPIPFTYESARWVASKVRQVQDILGMAISLENASYYFRPPGSDMEEADFIKMVINESGCNFHLDVNNIFVNSQNLGFDAQKYLRQLPLNKVNYLHVAGHYVDEDGFIIDTHGADVIDPVWDLLADAYTLIDQDATRLPTCLERDFHFPRLESLLAELDKINSIQQRSGDANHQANLVQSTHD